MGDELGWEPNGWFQQHATLCYLPTQNSRLSVIRSPIFGPTLGLNIVFIIWGRRDQKSCIDSFPTWGWGTIAVYDPLHSSHLSLQSKPIASINRHCALRCYVGAGLGTIWDGMYNIRHRAALCCYLPTRNSRLSVIRSLIFWSELRHMHHIHPLRPTRLKIMYRFLFNMGLACPPCPTAIPKPYPNPITPTITITNPHTTLPPMSYQYLCFASPPTTMNLIQQYYC